MHSPFSAPPASSGKSGVGCAVFVFDCEVVFVFEREVAFEFKVELAMWLMGGVVVGSTSAMGVGEETKM
eukprot:889067-Amorphochlora_amoeboformis.AAC.1